MPIDDIIAYENGELSEHEVVEMFADGIRDGWIWRLQGRYGRMAHSLIQNGIIDEDGLTIHWQYID